jgi:uncharacterized protein (DUF4213/DUF364 family)
MVSGILKESYELLRAYYGENPPEIKSLVRGHGFIGAQLTDMSAGMALVERDWPHEFPVFLEKDDHDLPDVYALAKKGFEGQGMEVCYGIAILNALTTGMLKNSDKYEILEDAEVVELWKNRFKPDDVIGMVGNMAPLIEILKPLCSKVVLLDKHAFDSERLAVPSGVEVIPSADGLIEVDVLIATGSSLIYHSTEELIDKTPNARLKAVIGPSATLPAEPFWNRDVQFVGGSMIDERFVQTLVMEDMRMSEREFFEKQKTTILPFGKDTGIRKIGLMKPE